MGNIFAKTSLLVGVGALLVGSAYAETERFIVRVRDGQSQNQAVRSSVRAANMEALSNELIDEVDGVEETVTLNKVGVLVVEGDKKNLEETLKEHPLVDYVERDITWKVNELTMLGQETPSSQQKNSWLADLTGLTANQAHHDVPVPDGQGVIVAVVDSGAAVGHPYLSSALYRNSNEIAGNGVDDDGNGYIDDVNGANVVTYDGGVSNDSSHGTHVSGLVKTIRDQAVAMGYANAAKVQVLPVKFINNGVGSTSSAILALNYALSRGAKVINCSWGSGGHSSFSQALYDTMSSLYYKDVFFSVAAGNSSQNTDSTPYFPSSLNIPALMSVAALTADYGGASAVVYRSSFSNYGSQSVDIAAVGAMVDENGSGGGIWSTYSGYTSGSYWIKSQGTSMAAPLIAGTAGVIKALNSALTNYEIKRHILSKAVSSTAANGTKSGARLDAGEAIRTVASISTQGYRPSISGPAYLNQQDSAGGNGSVSTSSSGTKLAAGCGTIAPVGSGDGEGPLGGNSIPLVTLIYALYMLASRKIKKLSNFILS